VLTTHCHEHLVGPGEDAAPGHHTMDQLLDQHLVVGLGEIRGAAANPHDVHRIPHALPPVPEREQRRVDLTAHEGVPIVQVLRVP